MSASTIIDLIVNQKSSFQVYFNIKDSSGEIIDLTGYTADAKFKENFQSPDNSAVAFNTIISNTSAGEISISLTPDQTSNMNIGRYVYDLTITDNTGYKIRVCEGKIIVSGGVS